MDTIEAQIDNFENSLRILINVHGKDAENDTADYILASYLCHCLDTFRETAKMRDVHEGRGTEPPVDLIGKVWEDDKPLPASRHPAVDWRAPIMDPFPVDGHESDCKIDLDIDWHECTCGAG